MTQVTKKGHGGPKTAAGKKIVSTNARKASIFSQGYLPDEDVSGKQERLQEMADQWGAHDPSRQLLLLTIEQSQLGIERMMKAERMKIEGIMASVNFSREFCVRAGISVSLAAQLPDWYFSDDARALKQKQRALKLPIVWKQADNLKSNYSDGLMSQVHDHSPELYDYVSEGFRAGHSFSTMLGSRYQQSTTLLNLACLMNEINQNEDHLRWAEHPKRYQKIIDGLKAEKTLEALDFEKSSRYATNFQNRILKAFAGLAAIDQHEARSSQSDLAIEVDEAKVDSESSNSSSSDLKSE